jgi:2-oxoglutarate dehydrogenase E1 component
MRAHLCLYLSARCPVLLPLGLAQKLYQTRLLGEGISDPEIKALSDSASAILDKAYEESLHFKSEPEWLSSNWKGFKGRKDYSAPQPTGVDAELLVQIGATLAKAPEGFKLIDRLEKKIIPDQAKTIATRKGIEWGTAEAFAFGSLLLENKHIRLSGQDVERGTFSHRHSVWHDQSTNETYTPLNNLAPTKQAHFTVSNSHLSEYAVLGFEVGYSLENPHALVLWEAQFGDFFNTAQVIVDQFIASGEDKWSVNTCTRTHVHTRMHIARMHIPSTRLFRSLCDSL